MLSQLGRNHCIALLSLAMFVAGCSGQAARPPVAESRHLPSTPRSVALPKVERRTVGEYAAVAAVRQVGAPYRYGGSNTRGFDCSGLISYAYSTAGKVMPRTTSALWRELHPVAPNALQVGDVLFFDIEGKMSHVGLYLGDRRFVHAPSTGKSVTVASLDSTFYRRALIRGGRPR